MSKGLLIQYIVLGVVVAVSVLVLLRKLAPQLTRRGLAAVSMRLSRSDSRLVKAIARRLQPRQGAGDCGDGCSTCGGCAPKKPLAVSPAPRGPDAPAQERVKVRPITLHFRPRGR